MYCTSVIKDQPEVLQCQEGTIAPIRRFPQKYWSSDNPQFWIVFTFDDGKIKRIRNKNK